jgi:hypothetical protein
MTNVNSYYGYPTGYQAGILWANAPGCNGSAPYLPSEVENEAVSWLDNGDNTLIEIDMSSSCDSSISDYESLASAIYNNVDGRVSAATMTNHFGGFMVDEEPWFWTSASAAATAYSDFNEWITNNIQIAFSESGNAGGYWTQAQYTEVTWTYTWAAPQVYNVRTEDNQNYVVDNDSGFYTLVTCYPLGGYLSPFDTCSDAAGVIHGSPYTSSEWGSGNFYNMFQPS